MAKRQSSSRYLLAGSRDTANESRYDGSWRYDDKVYTLSSQCLTLGSSFPYNLIENVVTTFCASLLAYKQTFLDPSVKHWDDTIIKESVSATFMTPFFFLDPSSQGTGMTP
ncbi:MULTISPECIES: hypothetical protein [unclassified Wolbachia]|uniref:hypothetical protein n=1 Tax=unclassified Wolbachia TaxID=2640676 RepID=UPI0021F82CFC|nr:hypothetical protein [Wolbachia endosymbiont (group A) of Cheilosia soror]